jgi:hypothetical protein
MSRITGRSSVAPAPAGSTTRSTTIQDERQKLRTLTNIKRGFLKSIDAYAVVLVLLVTLTYPTFSQPPGSFDDDGLMRTSCNPRLVWFVYLNSFSFFFSMTDLLLCLGGKYAPMSYLCKRDPAVERGDPRTKEELAKEELGDPKTEKDLVKFNKQLAHSVLFTLTKLLVINVLFVLSLTCCLAAYISAGSAVQQLPISNRLSIIIPGFGGCLLYVVFVGWLFFDFAWFFSLASCGFAKPKSPGSGFIDCFTDFCTMICFFLSLGGSSCTGKRFQVLAEELAETTRQWRVRQLFNEPFDEIDCYFQNIPAPISATRNNTPHELNAAEQTSQQQQHRSTETSNNAAAAAAAADFRAPQSEEEEAGGEGHGPEAEADLHGPVANSRTSLGVRCSSFRCSTCYGIPCECGTGLTQS